MGENKIVGTAKEVLKKSSLQKPSRKHHRELVHKKRTNFRLQDEDLPDVDLPFHDTMHSFPPNTSHMRQVSCSNVATRNQYEDLQESEHEVELEVDSETYTSHSQQEENIGSTSHGTTDTRKETRALSDTRKSRLSKGKLAFEVDECAGRIVGEHSEGFITKSGCITCEHAKFDGTTWRNQPDLLKADIINKCTENSTFDVNSVLMVRAINTQLASQHRNRQYKFHNHYKKFSTKDEAMRHPPIKVPHWVNLCERFASENFQKISSKNKKNRSKNEVSPAIGTVSIARIIDMKRREGEQVSTIDQYKIAHFSKRKNKMVNEKGDEIWGFEDYMRRR